MMKKSKQSFVFISIIIPGLREVTVTSLKRIMYTADIFHEVLKIKFKFKF